MKLTLLTILLFFSKLTFGNMACPWLPGTTSSTALTSRDIDITRENLFIKINKKFDEAQFRIQYHIHTPESGTQIPLLFCAEKYKRDFRVWVDGKEVTVKTIEEFIKHTKHTKFHKFKHNFYDSDYDHSESISISWSEVVGNVYKLSDLQYFEIDLLKGAHLIEVVYTASHYTMIGDRDFFIYSLSPAEHWKSFHKLFVEIDNSAFGKEVITNLGKPSSGNPDSIATWEFNQLPHKFIEIAYTIKQKEKENPKQIFNRFGLKQKGEKDSWSPFYLIFTVSICICLILLYVVIRILRR